MITVRLNSFEMVTSHFPLYLDFEGIVQPFGKAGFAGLNEKNPAALNI